MDVGRGREGAVWVNLVSLKLTYEYLRLLTGATSAPSLIFILPGLFYIRIVPTEQEPMTSRNKIQVDPSTDLTGASVSVGTL